MDHVVSEEDGSVYTVENGTLIQHPMYADGSWSRDDGCEVDWYCGVEPDEEPRLREIQRTLLIG